MNSEDKLAAGGYDRVGALFDERGRVLVPGTIENSDAALAWRLAQRPLGRLGEVVEVTYRKRADRADDVRLRALTAWAMLALAGSIVAM